MLRTPSTKSATRSTQGHTSAPIEVNGNSHCFDRVESRAWLDTSMLCGPVRYSRPIPDAEHCAARDRGRPSAVPVPVSAATAARAQDCEVRVLILT
jgi:hypothetical protein